MALQILDALTLADFEQMAALEARCYQSDFIAPAQEAYAWYLRYPATTVALGEDGPQGRQIAGFVNLFPVVDGVFEALKTGTFNDANLTVDHIADVDAQMASGRPLHMFLSCIAIEERYRGQGLACALVRVAATCYERAAALCDWIVTDNVTDYGERFSQRLGFELVRESDHGSRIYLQEYQAFLRNLGR